MKNILEGPRVQVAHRRRLLVGRQLGRIWLIAWIVVAAALIGRSLWSSGPPAKHVADAAPHSGAAWNDSSRLAEPDQSPSRYQFRAIEELRVGDRVVSDNPDVASPVQTAVNPQTWRLLRLYAEERWPDGTLDTIHVETLQSPEWVEAHSAIVGAKVPPPLDLLEMGLSEELRATVVANEPCPQLDAGSGRLVLTTVNHLNADIWELAAVPVRGPPADAASPQRETLRPTGLHKFYSETRCDWVATQNLHDNEVIRGRTGSLTIVSRKQLPGIQRVYNLTIEGEHAYYVSHLALLTHNNCGDVLVDSNLIGALKKDPTLGGNIAQGQRAVRSYVTAAELRGAASRSDRFNVPGNLEDVAVLTQRPNINTVINLRARLTPKQRGNLGDGIIGAQALELNVPLISGDKALVKAVNDAGGQAIYWAR